MPFSLESATSNLISSGAVIAAAGYLFWLSGAIIADAKAYHDDRAVTERVMGPVTAISYFAWPGLATAWLLGKVHFWSAHSTRAFVLLLIQGTILFIIEWYSERANRMRSPLLASIDKSVDESLAKTEPLEIPLECPCCEGLRLTFGDIVEFFEKHGEPVVRLLVVPALATLSLYLCVLEFQSGDVVWSAFFAAELFVCFVLFMGTLSLFVVRRGKTDIYYKDDAIKPMRGAVLLKVGTDFVRVIYDGSVHLIAKDMVLRMESPLDPKRYMGEKVAVGESSKTDIKSG